MTTKTINPFTEEIDWDARYAVAGYEGIAFYLLGHPQLEEDGCEGHPCDGEEGFESEPIGEVFYCNVGEGCNEPTDDLERVRAVMVGDDYEHIVEVSDLRLLDEDDYCHECGQVGCTHDGRER